MTPAAFGLADIEGAVGGQAPCESAGAENVSRSQLCCSPAHVSAMSDGGAERGRRAEGPAGRQRQQNAPRWPDM